MVTAIVVIIVLAAAGTGVLLMPASLITQLPRPRRDRRARVRIHLVDPPGMALPSVEGLLVSRRRGEYAIAVPKLVSAPEGAPVELESQLLMIPHDRVAFYEVISG